MDSSSPPWSELELIRRFASAPSSSDPRILTGIGDDCAVIRGDDRSPWVITTDMLVDTFHFNVKWHPPYELGRKCMAVNLSDIAAMGASPQFALIAVAIPGDCAASWIESWMDGARSMLQEFSCALIGGDTVAGERFTVSVTVIGRTADGLDAILRSTARPGENIYVSGSLGSAAAGLELCRTFSPEKPFSAIESEIPFVTRHLDPLPDIPCGIALAESGFVTAMQDISDGIATDLSHMAEQSGVQAVIDVSLLPADPGFERACARLGCDPVSLQLTGGDDYHLVFTVKSGCDRELIDFLGDRKLPAIYRIGETAAGSGVYQRNTDGSMTEITFQGYQHRGSGKTA